jgi:PhnB protein
MQVQPYVFFEGRCEEALNFYKKAVGAQVDMLMRFKESPDQTHMAPGSGEKVMHASVRIGGSTLFASDGRCTGAQKYDGFSLSLAADSVADAEKYFAALGEGGKVMMPLSKTFFAKSFGMVTDRFGVMWMVIVM